MPKVIRQLTPSQVQNAKPKAEPYVLRDGRGLWLLVEPTGAKLWRWQYRRPGTGKRNTLSLGAFPTVPLSGAREKRDALRKLLTSGIDPGELRKADAAERKATAEASEQAQHHAAQGNFRAVAQSWLEMKRKTWATETRRKAELILSDYLLPALGDADMATLTSRDARAVLEAMAATVPDLARKARSCLSRIAEHAMEGGYREDGRVLILKSEALSDALRAAKRGHIPAATDLTDVRQVVQVVAAYPVPVTRAALTVAMLTAQRPGNVAAMEWTELDLDLAEWSIPSTKMKMAHAHIVPLASQAVAELRAMQAYSAGRRYVFPPLARQRTEHLHRDTLSKALRDSGLRGLHATHGFRATLRTVARERLGIDTDVLEAQLAHAKKGNVQKAYDRTAFLAERHQLMQAWADYLEDLRTGADVVPFKRKAS